MGRPFLLGCLLWMLLTSDGAAECRRIVTLSPALTEIAFALGLSDRVVGVSRFVDYPAIAAEKPTVGGLLDPHIERIAAIQPDAVFAQREQEAALAPLRRLGLTVRIHDHQSVQGILSSILALGAWCGVSEEAERLVAQAKDAIASALKARPAQPLRVMVVIAEDAGAGVGGAFWVSGSDGFYSELVEIAGGKNINTGRTVGMATLSMEGVLSVAPDVVLMIATPGVAADKVVLSFVRSWRTLFPAVPPPRVRGFEGSYAWVPGPRFVALLRDVQAALTDATPPASANQTMTGGEG